MTIPRNTRALSAYVTLVRSLEIGREYRFVDLQDLLNKQGVRLGDSTLHVFLADSLQAGTMLRPRKNCYVPQEPQVIRAEAPRLLPDPEPLVDRSMSDVALLILKEISLLGIKIDSLRSDVMARLQRVS